MRTPKDGDNQPSSVAWSPRTTLAVNAPTPPMRINSQLFWVINTPFRSCSNVDWQAGSRRNDTVTLLSVGPPTSSSTIVNREGAIKFHVPSVLYAVLPDIAVMLCYDAGNQSEERRVG